jgi:protein dithiol:quinone oxidoreductase
MKLPAPRLTYFLGLVVITLVLGFTAFLQAYESITPCPLCILQRLTLMVLGILFFFGAIVKFRKMGQHIIGAASALVAFAGVLFAGRQVWMQYVPSSDAGNCGVSLNYMLQTFPFKEVVDKIFNSGVDCARIDWTILHLSLAVWSLVCFLGFLGMTIWQFSRSFHKHHHTK